MNVIIGKVQKDQAGKPRVYTSEKGGNVKLYLGNKKIGDAGADVHVNVTAWFSYASDRLKNLTGEETIMLKGQISNKKNRDGQYEINFNVDDNNIEILDDNVGAQYDVYANTSEVGYIFGAFVANAGGGYDINLRTKDYAPYYKKASGGLFEKVNRYDEREIRYRVGPKTRAFKTINRLISTLTGADIGDSQATADNLKLLQGYQVIVKDSFFGYSDKKEQVNGQNRQSLFLNNYLTELTFLRKTGKKSEIQPKSTGNSNNQATPSNSQSEPPAHFNDIPLNDDEGFDGQYIGDKSLDEDIII